MSFCTAICLSFLRTLSLAASTPSSHKCLTMAPRSFVTSTDVGRFRMLNRIGWITKFALPMRHFRSFAEAFRCNCSDLESLSHFSEFSLMSPMVRRYFHLAFSCDATPFFGFFSCVNSVASFVETAGLSTSRRPLRLMPNPSTAGNSRLSLLRTTAESSLSFFSASASTARAAAAPSASTNFTKAEPLWLFSPFGSATSFTVATLPNFCSASFRSSAVASNGTFRTKTVRFSSRSKPGFRKSFFSLGFASSSSSSSLSSPRRPFMRLTSAPASPLAAASSSPSSSSSFAASCLALVASSLAFFGFLAGSCFSSRCRLW
mmetsp:Transcript_104487/g.312010  ORF Transcript_104487/g.312010 Transcript_104487/m.312010 type:complete len:318 (-) Transcript_104487:402-1355(-)